MILSLVYIDIDSSTFQASYFARLLSTPNTMSELDEINKTRIAAGLQPIPVPGSSAADNGSGEDGQGMQVDEDPDVVAQRNYQERMEQDRKERETK